jgi:hypothetical protein
MKLKQKNLKQLIAILENATSKEETRWTMQCIRIGKHSDNTKREVELVGTDGHILCKKIIQLDADEEFYDGGGYRFIDRNKIGFLKLLAKEKHIPQDVSQYFESGDVSFPCLSPFNDNFERKYPIQISLNPELLSRILSAVKDTTSKSCGVTLSFDDKENNSPVVVSCGDSDNLLMPMRGFSEHGKWKQEVESMESVAV